MTLNRLLPGLALVLGLAGLLATAPARADDAPAPAAAASAPVAPSAAMAAAAPGDAASAPAGGSLDDRIEGVKSDVIDLNRDLLMLEEDLLFPANTQVALFLSMDVGVMFDLDSVQVRIDDKPVANYLYTPREIAALHRGGVQRLYLGNLKTGPHELVAFFTGKGPHDRDYKRAASVKFDKGPDPRYIELQIQDDEGKLQPQFHVRVWQ